jgi:hypothetical protein
MKRSITASFRCEMALAENAAILTDKGTMTRTFKVRDSRLTANLARKSTGHRVRAQREMGMLRSNVRKRTEPWRERNDDGCSHEKRQEFAVFGRLL